MTDRTSHITEAFNIGTLRVPNRLLQAPMAGITGRAFRLQARRFGAGLLATEMISSYGVHFSNRRTRQMLELTPAEHPASVQLFGNRPDMMAEAAVAAAEAGADAIDVNMGCPVRKVVKTGAGVALMGDEELAARIISAMRTAVDSAGRDVPVTVKLRAGISSVTAPSLAARLVDAGAAAIAIHPRLAGQGRKGQADHEITKALADQLGVPVIASGDIREPVAVEELLDAGIAGIMVARAALGFPWIFSDLLAGEQPWTRPPGVVLDELRRFYKDLIDEAGASRADRAMRKFYAWYLAPLKPPAGLRDAVLRAGTFAEAEKLIGRLMVFSEE